MKTENLLLIISSRTTYLISQKYRKPNCLGKKERKEVTLIIKTSKLKHAMIPKEDKDQKNRERILAVTPYTEKSLCFINTTLSTFPPNTVAQQLK